MTDVERPVDEARRLVMIDEQHWPFEGGLAERPLELTSAEFSVLRCFLENSGRTLSRDEIFQQLRGSHWDSVDRSVDVVVSRGPR